jgi:hypothetical protein
VALLIGGEPPLAIPLPFLEKEEVMVTFLLMFWRFP